MLNMGLEKFFVIDGVGALLGVLPGKNRGSPVEIIRDLKRYCAPDGVHFTDAGYEPRKNYQCGGSGSSFRYPH
jgi:hypothetical protein